MRIALTIAGSDSSGGAGIQADLKTFQALGVFGMSALTAVTVQNTQKVYSVQEMTSDIVFDQIICLFNDIPIDIVKVGMVPNSKIAASIAEALRKVATCPIVLDPVMISKSGYFLSNNEARERLVDELVPMSFVITPNLYEAEILTGCKIESVEDMKEAACMICDMGAKNIVVKGGHLKGHFATDVVFDGQEFNFLESRRIETLNTHGTGCTFSSSIAAYMAHGHEFVEAALLAKKYINGAIRNSLNIGKGCGPTNHFFDLYKRSGILS